MKKNPFIFWGLAIIACLSLLAGCNAYSATSPPAQNTSPTSQAVNATSLPAVPTITQNTPSSQPATSTTDPTSVASVPKALVNIPSFADLLDAAENSVVKIDTIGTGTNVFGRTVQEQGAGSGWIMDANGTIVTNDHVIEGATTITVTTLDGKTFPAQVINSDPTTDLALLKINAGQLQSIKIGDASILRKGDWVLAIGNPLGEGIIATQGIISRLGVDLSVSSTQTYNNLIETTAAINPGNSGGPLVNMAGEVIGITSVKVSASGIEGMGYAINMVDALPVIQKLSAQ